MFTDATKLEVLKAGARALITEQMVGDPSDYGNFYRLAFKLLDAVVTEEQFGWFMADYNEASQNGWGVGEGY